MPIDTHTRFVCRQKNEATSFGSSSNAMSREYGNFDERSQVFVAKMFHDVTLTLSSLSESAGSDVAVVEAMTFVMMTVVYFMWSTSSEGRSKFSKGLSVCLPFLVFRRGPGAIGEEIYADDVHTAAVAA